MIIEHYSAHLDLGASTLPRNPYTMEKLFAVDVQDLQADDQETTYVQCDFALNSLPFPDNFLTPSQLMTCWNTFLDKSYWSRKTKSPFHSSN
jgi:hypothetical protein